MLGDVLKRNIQKLKFSSEKATDRRAFWIVLRDIAREEIIECGDYVDSDIIIPIYYKIISENMEFIPQYYQEILPSNQQERFRVVLRNLFSSNAFHADGLANQEGIVAHYEVNERKKGKRVVYKKV